LYPDIPEAKYRAWPYPSQSQLSWFRDPDLCELDIQYRLEHPTEQTDAMQLGHWIEAAVDGLPFGREVQKLPPEIKARRGAAWQEFSAANPGIEWLPTSEYAKHGERVDLAEACAASVKANPMASALLAGAERQVSFVWDAEFIGATGENVKHRVKGRLDYLKENVDLISDLKSSSRGGQRSVGAQAWGSAWDIQSALYTDAISSLRGKSFGFCFIVVRTSPPFPVSIYNGHNTAEEAGRMLSIGRSWYQRALEQLAACRETGRWRSFVEPFNFSDPESVLDFQYPPWAG